MANWDISELTAFERRLDSAPIRMNRIGTSLTKNSAKRMVSEAKGRHPWQNRTGNLETDIKLIRTGRFERDEVGAEWGVDTTRRGFVGAILEATGWEFMRPAEAKYHKQWVDRIRQAAVTILKR